jgi:iron complex transport system ATP-binding protein
VVKLEVSDLEVRYHGRPALHGVHLEVRAGELVAVCGPNGAGKSTLLRCVAGLLRPWRGSVRVDGQEVASLPPRQRARVVGYLPQGPVVPEGFRCVEVVRLGRYASGEGWTVGWSPQDHLAAVQALSATGTQHLADRPVLHTSGGERQRVLLARVLVQGARLLALDEPTSHLDLSHQVSVVRLLRRLAGEGYGVLVATHEVNLASLFFDRLVLLAGGRVLAQGPSQDVLRSGAVAEAYGPVALVVSHPEAGKPVVLPRVRP